MLLRVEYKLDAKRGVIHSDESKVHIEVLSVLWENRLSIPNGSRPFSRFGQYEVQAMIRYEVWSQWEANTWQKNASVRGWESEPMIGCQVQYENSRSRSLRIDGDWVMGDIGSVEFLNGVSGEGISLGIDLHDARRDEIVRLELMVTTKALTLRGLARSFLLRASAAKLAFPG
ncbi:hypothetical protein Tco_0605893 [Tanacetum coccineum]